MRRVVLGMDPSGDPAERDPAERDDTKADEAPTVIVFTRRGCGFSMMLRRDLKRRRIPFEPIDIWADENAAAFVRSVARGNETVPTVLVGDVAVVNPSGAQVERMVAEHAPELLADRADREPDRWLDRVKSHFRTG